MDPRFFTILVVPGEQGRSYRFSLSRNFLVSLAILAVLSLVGVLALLGTWSEASALAVDVEKLGAERARADMAEERERLRVFRLSRRIEALTMALEEFRELSEPDFVPDFVAAGGVVEDPVMDFEDSTFFNESPAALAGVMEEKADFWIELMQDKIQGKLVLLSCTPSVMPVKGLITHGFAWRRDPFTGRRAFHTGLDISARRGSPVSAPADGVVTRAGWLHGYGKVVEINHGYGITSRYGHLHRIDVEVGDVVQRGDGIGQVGSTGRSTGPHLHYEVLENGKSVNPYPRYLLEEPSLSTNG